MVKEPSGLAKIWPVSVRAAAISTRPPHSAAAVEADASSARTSGHFGGAARRRSGLNDAENRQQQQH